MTQEEETVFAIKGIITELSATEQEACKELADHMRRQIASAGHPVGTLAMALIGAEAQLKASRE